MYFSTALTITLATLARATIDFGTQGDYKVAWISGDNPCASNAEITNVGNNPCDKRFWLRNGYSYQLRACGTASFALWNGDGSYNHIATYHPGTIGCDSQPDVHREWTF